MPLSIMMMNVNAWGPSESMYCCISSVTLSS